MRPIAWFIIFVAVILPPSNLFAAKGTILPKESTRNKTSFIENKGQIIDQNNQHNPAVLYLLNTPGMNVQLRKGGFSYDLYRILNIEHRTSDSELFHQDSAVFNSQLPIFNFHRIDLDLVGSDPDCEIIASEPSADFQNYYTTGTPNDGVKNVRSFKNVTYKNIYPYIDLEFMVNERQEFKYNVVVRPGGKISSVRLKIKGAGITLTDSGSLLYKTSIDIIEEDIPQTWFLVHDRKIDIHSVFNEMTGGYWGMLINETLPRNTTLVIDPVPNRLWSTYYGGMNANPSYSEAIHAIKIDNDGNILIAGESDSPNNIATAGSFQSTTGGAGDAFLAKFTPDGVRLWGTYYGGSGQDIGYGCAINAQGEIYLTGQTGSPNQIATPGTHQSVLGGPFDAFVAKFNQDGVRQWGTYYGGWPEDQTGVCTIDKEGNIYIAGKTESLDSIATPGAFQTVNGGGGDAYLAKFSPAGQLLWGTYYGGQLADYILGICADTLDHIIITGNTKSQSNISTPGAHQENYGGGGPSQGDGFIVLFNTAGQRLWGTYYGGSNGDDVDGCVCNNEGSVYFIGDTGSPDNISTPGSYQPTLSNNSVDAMIIKFNLVGVRQWGTYYGGNDNDWGFGIDYDPRGALFVSGTTISSNAMASSGAFQTVYQGGWDAFLAKFDTNGFRIWGTYYGGSSKDQGYACISDTNDRQYLAGTTISTTGIATVGSHQPVFGGPTYDGFMVKFTDCVNPHAGPITGPVAVCLNSSGKVYSIPPIYKATGYVWEPPGGATITTGQNTRSVTVNFSSLAISGNISVHAINHCGVGDTSTLFITINSLPVPVIGGDSLPCMGPIINYTTQGGKTGYQWTISPGGSIISGGGITDNISGIIWNQPGPQWIRVNYTDSNGCTASQPLQFNLNVNEATSVTNNPLFTSICSGDSTHLQLTASQTGTTFTWTASSSSPQVSGFSSGSGSFINQQLFNAAGQPESVTYQITPHLGNCHGVPVDYSVMVKPLLAVSILIAPSTNPVCTGTSVTFTATPVNGGTAPAYQWQVNAINVTNTNNAIFTYYPVSGDLVSCVLTSSELCTTNNPASGIPVQMIVNPLLPVSLTITASSNPFCINNPVTFTAIPINGGTTPTYQWKVNANNAGINNAAFTYIPASGDVVTCILSSSVQCPLNITGTSNAITMAVNLNLPAGVTITTSANPFCPGTPVTFNASPVNGGSSPFYQWRVNAGIINAGINNAVFTYNPSSGDSVTCILNSNLNCVTNNPALSNTIVMQFSPVPAVTFSRCFDSITTTNAQPFKLKGGLPLGGTYSGPGVNSSTGIYSPTIAGPGVHIINYSYTNVSNCTSSATFRVFNSPFSIFNCGSALADIRDNKHYETFSLPNGKCWMRENLDFGILISDLIPQTDNCTNEKYKQNPSLVTGHWSFYQWDELMCYDPTPGSQGLCPPGWHVPTSAEWDELLSFYNGAGQSGGFLKDTLLVNGFNSFQKGLFYLNNTWSFMTGIYAGSMYWTSTLSGSSTPSGSRAIARGLNQYNPSVSKYESLRGNAFSVRCVKD